MVEHFHAQMDRKIFSLDLPVETTSAYILVTSLVEGNIRPSRAEIEARWTKSESDLEGALAELVRRRILREDQTPEGQALYYPNPASLWLA